MCKQAKAKRLHALPEFGTIEHPTAICIVIAEAHLRQAQGEVEVGNASI